MISAMPSSSGDDDQDRVRHQDDASAVDDVRQRAGRDPEQQRWGGAPVCTSATISADGVSVAMSHAATVVCIV